MKRIFFAAILCLLAVVTSEARTNPGEKTGVTFDKMVYDFGTVKESGPNVKHEFVMTVTGDSPVAILQAHASCGCTRPSYDRKPVRPGEKSVIKVTFVPKGQKGEVNKEIRLKLKSANGKSEAVTLRLTGVVTP